LAISLYCTAIAQPWLKATRLSGQDDHSQQIDNALALFFDVTKTAAIIIQAPLIFREASSSSADLFGLVSFSSSTVPNSTFLGTSPQFPIFQVIGTHNNFPYPREWPTQQNGTQPVSAPTPIPTPSAISSSKTSTLPSSPRVAVTPHHHG